MANSDKNIRISTNKDTTALPKIVFTGQGNLPITLNVLDDNTLSFEGSSGQLFSINNVLSTGYIFSINDISGIPSFRVNADGTVGIAEFLGNVGIGLTNPAYKLQVSGSAGISGTANISGVLTLSSTIGSGSTTTGALVVSGGVGIGGSIFSSSAYASSLSGVVFNNGAITNTGTITSTGTMSISNSSTTAFSVRDGSNNPAFTIDTIGDIISLPVAIASTTTGTGSLVVAGGVGIGGSVNVGGRVGIGTNLLSGQLNIKTSSAATPGLVVQGAASQTADYAQFFTSTGTTSLSITKDAEIKFPLAQDIKIYATPYASVGAIKTTGNFFALGGLIFAYGVSDSLSGSLSPTQLLISGLDWSTYSSGSTIRWATNNPVRIQPTGTSVVPLHINLNNASWTSGNSFEIANNGDLRFSIDYTGSTKIFSTVGSGSTTTGALVVTGGVGIGGSLNVNSASSISGIRIDSGILYGNLTGTATTAGFATTANYSNQSGYGLTSGLATTSTYSHQAGYAITSGSTGSATTSTYAHQSGYATTSGLATTATYSYQAGYGITAGLATTATYSLQSGYAITSGLATTATNVYVNSAGNANASHPILFTPISSSSGSAVSSDATISFNPSTEILNVSGLAVTSGTASIGPTSGALTVAGGVGITGRLNVGDRVYNSFSGYTIAGFAVSFNNHTNFVIQNAHPGPANHTRLFLANDLNYYAEIRYANSHPSYYSPNLLSITNDFGNVSIGAGSGFTVAMGAIQSNSLGIRITATTASGSTTTGALVVTGGVGIGGSLFTFSSNASSISGVVLNNGAITNTGTITSTGVMTLSNSSTTAFQVRDGSNNARLSVDTVGGVISISSSTASGSTTTGALTVFGGVGIGGSVNIGKQLTVSGTTRINSSVFNNPPTSSIGASLVQSGYIFGSFWTELQLENGYLIYGRKVPGGSIIIEEPLTGAQVGGTGNVFAEALQHFKWGNDKYVVLASSGNSVLYSTSLVGAGNSWYYATLPTTASWQKLEYGNNRFIAIATGSTSAYSLDGINWTLSTLPGNYTWSDIKHGNGVFVAGTGSTVAYTYDGIEWTIASNNVASTHITFGNGIFFANSTSNTASYSRDGISWTNTTLPSDTHRASAYGNGVFVNVGNSTTSYYSTDLINWVSGPGGSDGTTPALLYFNNLFYFKENGSGYGKVVTGPTGTLDFSSRYTGEINNVRIGAITPGAAEFTALAAVGPVRFVSDAASTNYKSGSVVVSGGVGIGGSLYVSSATAISGVTINAGVITGSLTGTASTATYAHQSGYAITSGTATTATYAHQSGYATTSGLATTSTYAYQSGYATTSGLATTATYSHQSGFASTSGSSGSATTANNINVVNATANSAHTLLFSPTATGSGVAVSSNTTLSYNPSTNVLSTSGLAITSTTASTSTATGALQVAGGVGISGRLSFNQASFGTTGISTNPTMAMIGNTGDPIFMSVLEDNTISFEGSQGQLFSITPNLSTGYIYSVNDITGIPLLRANANANVTANEYAGNFGIGITNPGYKLHVVGSVGFTSTTASTSTSTGTLVVSGGVGIGGSLYVASATAISGVTINNGVITGNLTGTATTATTATTAITVSVASAGSSNLAHSVLLTPNSSSGSAISSDATITFNPSTEILSVSGLAVTSTTGSSTTTTGALIVSGGVGIGGSFNVGNKSRFNDEVYINSLSNNALYSSGSGGVAYNWAVGGNLSSNKYFLGLDLGLHPVGGNQSVVQTFWGMQLVGNSGVVPASFTPTSYGSAGAIGVLVPNQQSNRVAFGIIANASQTADLQIWTSSTASTSSPYLAVKADGQIYSYITTPSTSYNTGALVVSGGVGIGGSLFVNGDLTINGTTTTINSVTISVDDKNIELGSVASPSDVTAEGGGITLKGATDKFINWYSGVGWSSSENWNLVVGSTYKINGTNVLTSTALGTGVTNSSLTSVGTITSGTWAGTTITAHYGGTGLTTPFTVGDLLYANSSTTWARLPANSNSGYVLTSAGSGSTPVYASASSITTGLATTAFNVNVVLATSNANHSLLFSPSLGTASGAAVSNDSTLVFNPSTEILTVSGLAITSSAATSSSSSGALIVSGGVGIGGSVIVGGRVGIGTAPNLSMLNIQTASAGTTGLSISASTSQSANLFEWYTSTGGVGFGILGRIRPTGEVEIGNNGTKTMSNGTNALLAIQGRGFTEGMLIRGFNSNLNEILFEIQGNPGNQLFGIYGDGGVNAPRINVTNSTGSTSTASGALIVTGGVGIGGSLNVSSASSISGVTFNSGTITGTLSGYATTSNNLRISSAGSSNLSHSVLFSPNSSTSGSAVSSDSTFTFNSSTEILSVSGLAITNTTSSTSTTTGALTVAGGVGIAGTVNILGDETVNGRLYYSQSTVGTAASSVIPSIMFVGQNNNPITLSVLADNTLSFEGSSGQLFSINNNLSSGTIFSVNDISGIPIIRANANGTLSMGEFTGTVGVGLTNPSFKFQVSGSAGFSGTVYVTGNSAFASTTASTSTSTGALTVSGGVGIGGSLYVNSASLISSVILSSGTVIGNLTGIATTASYAYQSGYGLTSGLATTATYALQSGYAITSGSSSFATTAGFATTSAYSLQSGYGITAGLATTATYALQSGYAITSGSSSFATTSGFATTASYSYQSGYGITAGFATSATSASVANTSYSVNVNAASANSSHYLIFSPSATGSGVALSTETALVYNPSTDILSVSGLAVTSSLGSTSTSTGALRITGGVGIGGSLYSGSILTAGRLQNQSFSGSSLGSSDGRSINAGVLSGHGIITYGNGVFVTNSSWGAYNAAYSTDGISWTASSLPVNQGYPVSMYGNGYFVLVASGATNVMYSTNGQSWSQVSIGNTFNRTDGAYGNGKYVVVGNGQTYNYSSNLTTWTSGTLPLTGDWRIAYGNGTFVALGYGTRQIIYSYDGIYWNIANTKVDYALNWTGLKYANGRFIASVYSGGGSAYSLDGINWYSAIGTGGENLDKISYGNGVYFVSSTGSYYTSGDGTTYNNSTPWSVTYEAGNTAYGLGKFQAIGRWIDGPTNTVTIEPKFTGEINNVRIGAITPASGDFTNLSSTGSANLVGTVNAYDLNIISKLNQTPVLGGFAGSIGWTSAGLLASYDSNYALAFGNGLFVQIKKSSNYTSYSPDGRQWVASTMPFSGNWMSLAWGVDKFVAVASAGTTGAYSGNGISWTSMSMPATAQGWYAVTYGDDKFVAVGNTSTAAYSSDGISWTGSSIANTNWTGVAYGNGTFVAVSGFGLSGAYSYDGINWNLINLPTNGGTGIKFITYGNGYFIVTNYVNNDINYSRDGINWATTVRTSTFGIKTDIAYGNGVYAIFNYQEGTYSYDGVNWLLGNTIAATDWQAVAYGNNRFVATSINTSQVGSIDGPSNTLNLHPKFTGDIDNVRIGAKQPAAAEFTNLAAQQPVRFTANTTSLNTTTGALVVVGGVGIGGSLYTSSTNTSSISGLNILNGSLSASTGTIATTNKLRISASDTSAFVVADGSNSAKLTVDTIGGIVTVSSSTASTSTTTGALVVTGGVGIGGGLYVKSSSSSTKGLVVQANASQTGNLLEFQSSTGSTNTYFTSDGRLRISGIVNHSDGSNPKIFVYHDNSAGGGILVKGANTDNFAAIEVQNNPGATVRIFPSGLVEAIKYTGYQFVLNATGYPGSSEFIMFNSPAGLMQFDPGATIALQRNFNIQGHEIRFSGTASTISKAVVVQLSGANYASTNCTITENIVFRVLTNITTAKGIVVQGATSQTANLFELQNSSSSTITSFNAAGELNISSSTASTSSSTGALVVTGGVGIGNTLYVAGRVDASNYKAWVENRTLSSVDTCVGIGTFFINNGAHNILISLNVSDGGYSVAKNYSLTSYYNIGGWFIVGPVSSMGGYGNNPAINFQLEAYQLGNNLTLRARSLGTGGNLKVYVQNTGQNTATFTSYSTLTSEGSISSYHPSAFVSQEYYNFKINSSVASTTTSSGAMVVTGGVGIGGSLYVNSASSISGVILSSGTVIGNLTGLATTSTYSHQSGYAITSGTASTATYSFQSGYGITAGLATTSTYSYQSGYGLTSGLATTATYSHQSGYAITSGSSSSSTSASIANTSYNVYVNAASANSSHYLIFSPTATGSGVALSSESALVYNPSSDILSVSGLAVTSGTASTSATTGALVVTGGVGIGLTLTVGLGISTPVISAPNNLLLKPGVDSTTGIQFTRSSAAIPVLTIDTLNSRVGIGLTNPEFDFEVNGSISATTKSFVIEHPTKKGMKLRYGSLEGPENGVYVRGELKDNNIIVLPDYWSELVDHSTITVHLTPIGNKFVYVKEIKKDSIIVGAMFFQKIHCFYSVWAERKDVPKLKVEI